MTTSVDFFPMAIEEIDQQIGKSMDFCEFPGGRIVTVGTTQLFHGFVLSISEKNRASRSVHLQRWFGGKKKTEG